MPTLEWIGKEKVINHHLEVPYRILEKKYTYKAESSENKIIHGDNLEALKSLLPEYEGKIKCIYIDPPYNTGNEKWVYNDNVNDPKIKKWLGEVVGQEGEDLSRHDKWLCMMYPRLKLLQKLLSEDGAIFISIDDNEQANLKLICDEIFGSRNFVAEFVWQKKTGGGQTTEHFVTEHEYIVIYAKSFHQFKVNYEKQKIKESDFNKIINGKKASIMKLEKWGSSSHKEDRPSLFYPVKDINGNDYFPKAPDGTDGRWRKKPETLDSEHIFWQKSKGGLTPYEVTYFDEIKNLEKVIMPRTIIYNSIENTDATKELNSIFEKSPFEFSKPKELITTFVKFATDSNSIILDSFAGSGTTAHAVLNMNKADGGNRKFILIEMMDYADNITAERVKRVIDGYGNGKNAVEGTGGDFSFYELGAPLFKEDGNLNDEVSEEEIRKHVYFMETKMPLEENACDNRYFMGKNNDTAYYFYYEKEKPTTLNRKFLSTIKTKAENYIIYADICTLSKEFLAENGIVFKKIPRDIKKL